MRITTVKDNANENETMLIANANYHRDHSIVGAMTKVAVIILLPLTRLFH